MAAIDEIVEAFATESDPELNKFVLVDDMLRAAETRGFLPKGSRDEKRYSTKEISAAFGYAIDIWLDPVAWQEHDLRRIDYESETSAQVFARHWDDDFEVYAKMRWWLRRGEDGKWKVVDIEDIDQGCRLSAVIGILLQASAEGASWVEPLNKLQKAIRDAAESEYETSSGKTYKALSELLEGELPDQIEALLLTMRIGSVISEGENVERALDDIERLEDISGTRPIAWYLEGDALSVLEQYEKAIDAYKKYSDLFGWDCDVCELVADAWLGLEQRDKAVEFARRGLKDNQQSWGCLATLAVALPDDGKSELDEYLKKHFNDEGLLEYVIDWSLEMDDQVAAIHVFSILKKAHPDSELIEYYEEIFDK